MDFLQITLLALIQALTEFLPVSSSAHLALAGQFFGWAYQSLAFDLALHFGTLLAVIVYYRASLKRLLVEVLAIRKGVALNAEQHLGLGIVLATIPAALVGISLPDDWLSMFREPWIIAINLAVFGLLLGAADYFGKRQKSEYQLGYRAALIIGVAQALALVPGVSRSGITITAGLLLGLDRTSAARYSFLMSVPIVSLAAAHGLMQIIRDGVAVPLSDFAIGIVISALAGIACIHLLLSILQRAGTWPFVLYRLALSAFIVVWLVI